MRFRDAASVLEANDVGSHTLPATGLYPHQWNWDSAFIALGWAPLDHDRAWLELETLVAAQSPDGMLAHIAYDDGARTYFPGPEWWGEHRGADGRRISAISQPAAAAICLRELWERAPDERARGLLAPLHRFHRFLIDVRGATTGGEPVVVHPWETGRDNAPEWDTALDRVPGVDSTFDRRDTQFVDAAERPTQEHYRRYLALCEACRDLGTQQAIAMGAPFRMLDPGTSAILAAACFDLAEVASALGEMAIADDSRALCDRLCSALDARRDSGGRLWALDLVAGGEEERTLGAGVALGLLQPGLADASVDGLAALVAHGDLSSSYGVRSLAPTDPRLEQRNYWRGPSWANVTWLCTLALRRHGRLDASELVLDRMRSAVDSAGFREYVDPDTGEGLGARGFAWTAALALWEHEGWNNAGADASTPPVDTQP